MLIGVPVLNLVLTSLRVAYIVFGKIVVSPLRDARVSNVSINLQEQPQVWVILQVWVLLEYLVAHDSNLFVHELIICYAFEYERPV